MTDQEGLAFQCRRLVCEVLEVAVRDAIRDLSKYDERLEVAENSDRPILEKRKWIKSVEFDRERAEHRKTVALGWLKTESFEIYCEMVNLSPAKIARGIREGAELNSGGSV